MPKAHETEITVRLSETDEFGVVWHGNYVLYFEVARTELAREFQLTSRDLKAAGLFPPVVDLALQCRLPAKNDDTLVVACTVDPLTSASITIRYRITRKGTGELIATGHSRQALVNEKGFLLYQVPAEIEPRLKALAEAYPSA
ncbi:MAG: acyl-CoA thioesterase [Planctomycetes bacterium]|nr:acyl-CoA thioesterase [Planctomycetota bacterium]